MNRTLLSTFGALLSLAIIQLGAGWANAGTVSRENRSIATGNARSVQVHVHMAIGELQVTGGARALMDAHFSYRDAAWRPKVRYTMRHRQGYLTVQQPDDSEMYHNVQDGDNVRAVRLNNHMPMEMYVEEGAGKNSLTLNSLALTRLAIDVGLGDTSINLDGVWKRSFSATIREGAGDLTIRLPSRVGVRVTVSDGIGDVNTTGLQRDGEAYVNRAYGTSLITVNVRITRGAGTVTLKTGASAS